MAGDWVGSAACRTADLQGRVLALGCLAGTEGHCGIILGLEQLGVLQSLESFWGERALSYCPKDCSSHQGPQTNHGAGALMRGKRVSSMTGRF